MDAANEVVPYFTIRRSLCLAERDQDKGRAMAAAEAGEAVGAGAAGWGAARQRGRTANAFVRAAAIVNRINAAYRAHSAAVPNATYP